MSALRKHGHSLVSGRPTPEYNTWRSMLQRCGNEADPSYCRYGARGIKVCERWKIFANFLNDMGRRSEGTTLDRFPNKDGDYEPGNCRWATAKEQQRNTRSNRMLSLSNETYSLAAWAERLKISKRVLQNRVDRGWTPERILTTPARKYA